MSNQLNLNPLASLILNVDCGTDTARVRKLVTRSQAMIDSLGLMLTPDAVKGANQKALMRMVQAVSFAVSGAIDDFNRSTAFLVSTIMLSSQSRVTYQDAHYLMGAHTEGANNIGGVSRARLQRFITRAGTTATITSQCSRTVGKRGFFTSLGITTKGDAHSFEMTPTARSNSLIVAYAYQLQTMTDGNLRLIEVTSK